MLKNNSAMIVGHDGNYWQVETPTPAEWLAHLPYILAGMPLPEKTALLLSVLRVFDAAPAEWLAMLPGVIAQIPPEQHEVFLLRVLRALDYAGLELAGCLLDEFGVAGEWR